MIKNLLFSLILLSATAAAAPAREYDFTKMIQPVPATAKFEDPGFIVWCGSMVRNESGKCHLFYSRWPKNLGHYAWVTSSEVAHAVANSPLGPYKFVDVALPTRGAKFREEP